ncbi:MAG TPA: hypothetical protein VNK96_01245 [Fimbriimonadales bacterium]|nr:hypothetical protein [Fimbriimonadales bacterium]
MIIILSCFLLSLGNPVSTETAQEIFNKMLSRYHQANSIKGSITFNQTGKFSGGSATTTTITNIHAKKPNFVYFEQIRKSREPLVFKAICDGKQLAYSAPPEWAQGDPRKRYLYEPAPPTLDGILNVFPTLLLDRSLPVALALYNPYEIKLITSRLTDLSIHDEPELDGKKVWRLSAKMSLLERASPEVSIPVFFYISKNYELLGVAWEETVMFQEKVQVTNQWIVKLELNAKVDEGLFKVP